MKEVFNRFECELMFSLGHNYLIFTLYNETCYTSIKLKKGSPSYEFFEKIYMPMAVELNENKEKIDDEIINSNKKKINKKRFRFASGEEISG
jgi:hypothetical protein